MQSLWKKRDEDLDFNDPLQIHFFVNAAIDADNEHARLLSRADPGLEDILREKYGIINTIN